MLILAFLMVSIRMECVLTKAAVIAIGGLYVEVLDF